MSGVVIAIDGPSASGKSSTARAVADALGFAHLDSGSLYRGVTLVALTEGAGAEPETMLRRAEDRGLMLHYDGRGFAAYLDGEPADAAIRGAEVTANVSAVSAIPVVREWVNSHLRSLVRAGRNVVIDGRDIGTVVFPDAQLKVFLTASPEARAGRRISQRGIRVDPALLEQEAALLAARDHADSTREVAPLRRAEDAVELDTTRMGFQGQVDAIVGLARERGLV
ncbi:MAG TPA: (d)CMP kinase [Gemmatimonadales bacterium]|nr:(d)CMP kinase [Gemmatimonadales bacterium]